MTKKRKQITVSVIRFLALLLVGAALTGCFDLGEYELPEGGKRGDENYDTYYASFGDVKAISGSGIKEYDVEESLFNKTTVNELSWDDGDTEVTNEDYIYLAIPIKSDMNIECVALYLKASEIIQSSAISSNGEPITSCAVNISAFLLESSTEIPLKIKKHGDPEYEEVDDPENEGQKKQVKIEYDDPPAENAICKRSVILKKDEWNGFMLEKWTVGGVGQKTIAVEDGNVLLLRFENNAGYGGDMPKCEFCFTNLLVRAAD